MRITLYQPRFSVAISKRPDGLSWLGECLLDAGHQVIQADNAVAPATGDSDLIWLQGNASWYSGVCRWLTQAGSRRPPVVLWHTEPLPPRPGSGFRNGWLDPREIVRIVRRDPQVSDPLTNAHRLRRLHRCGLPDLLIVSGRGRQGYLASCGIDSRFVPLGYAPKHHGRPLGLERDIDVLFLGAMDVWRRQRLVKKLERAGVRVRTEGSFNDHGLWGDQRSRVLNRTKILLNLQRQPGQFAGLRMILGMANGAMVISEPIDQPEPYAAGRHYVEASVDQIPAVIGHYLNHPQERERIAADAYRLVSEEVTMSQSLRHIMSLVAGEAWTSVSRHNSLKTART